MTELIFHIGMNKCASTTLQDDVFPNEPGYLGKFIDLEQSKDFGKQFQSLSPVGGRQFGDIKGVEHWLERVRADAAKKDSTLNRFIVSSESLCQSNKLSQRPIIPFLSSIAEDVIKDGSIKIIIVFRNQADMLASDYAQNSEVTYKSSQIDFENWVLNRINGREKSQLDWGGWAKELINTFGNENVCILLLEEFQKIGFWEELVRFIDTTEISANELYENSVSNRRNKLSTNDKTWRLTPFNSYIKARIDVIKVFNFLWSSNKFPTLRRFLIEKSIMGRQKYLEIRGFQNGVYGDSEIKLNKTLRKKIQNHFDVSNKLLSDAIGKDLKELGY